MVKNPPVMAGDLGSIPGLGRSPGGGHDNPFQYTCLENPHGQRSLEGYSPWCCKGLDTTKQLSTHSGCNKCTLLVENVDSRGMHGCKRYTGNLCTFHLILL